MEGTKRFAAGESLPREWGPGGGFFTLANTVLYEGARQQAEFFNELQRIALRSRLKIPLLQTRKARTGSWLQARPSSLKVQLSAARGIST